MNFKHGLFIAALGLLFVAGGCASPRGCVSLSWRLAQNDKGEIEPVQTVTLVDTSLAKKISLDVGGLVNNSGVLTAMNVITSLASSPLELEHRIDWLDDNGAILPSDASLWHGFTLKPGDTRFLNRNLPFPAAGYKISVRRKQ